jgi:transposase
MSGLHSNCTTEPDTFRRVEVITGVARRRHWPRSEKARIVAESYAPGASATAVAVRHGLHRNQIFAWRRQLRNRRRAQPDRGGRSGADDPDRHWV